VYLILLGAPGAGKGTQATVLCQELGLAHIASGDLFRQAAEEGTELGKLAKSYMGKGMLVPDEVTIQMISERLKALDCNAGCVLDGFPRTAEQAEALDAVLIGQGKAIDSAIYIRVAEAELLRRLSGRWICRNCQTPYHVSSSPPKVAYKCDRCGGELYQRSDDTAETIKERLKVYFDQTVPILDYYRQSGKLIEVDGELGIEEVAKKVLSALEAVS